MATCRLLFHIGLVASAGAQQSEMMRRQKFGSEQVHMGPSGEMVHRKEEMSKDLPQSTLRSQPEHASEARKVKEADPEPYCNIHFVTGGDASNDCPDGAERIDVKADCEHAITYLKTTTASIGKGKFTDPCSSTDFPADCTAANAARGDTDWEVSIQYTDPIPFPRGCILSGTDKVLWNEAGSSSIANTSITAGLKTICKIPIYKSGVQGQDSNADGCPATGGFTYTKMGDYDSCVWMHDCRFGPQACETTTFGNKAFSATDVASGCYLNDAGCSGFNSGTSGITVAADSGSRPVCQLSGLVGGGTFTPPGRPASSPSPDTGTGTGTDATGTDATGTDATGTDATGTDATGTS